MRDIDVETFAMLRIRDKRTNQFDDALVHVKQLSQVQQVLRRESLLVSLDVVTDLVGSVRHLRKKATDLSYIIINAHPYHTFAVLQNEIYCC